MESLNFRALIKTSCFIIAYLNYLYDKLLGLYILPLIIIYIISVLEIVNYKNYKINQSIIYGIVLILIIPFMNIDIALAALTITFVMIISLAYILSF